MGLETRHHPSSSSLIFFHPSPTRCCCCGPTFFQVVVVALALVGRFRSDRVLLPLLRLPQWQTNHYNSLSPDRPIFVLIYLFPFLLAGESLITAAVRFKAQQGRRSTRFPPCDDDDDDDDMCSSTRLLAPVIAILSGEFLPSLFLYLVRPRSFFLSFFVSLLFNDDDDVCTASIGQQQQQQQQSPFGEYVRRLQGEQAARGGGGGMKEASINKKGKS